MTTTDAERCETDCVHPAQVAAAWGRLAVAPAPDRVAALFGILGDPTRVKVLTALGDGELCVCDLAVATGVNRTTISHQLRVLRDHRLVRRRRDGKIVYYALDDGHVRDVLTIGAAHVAEPAAPPLGVEDPADHATAEATRR
ncbi:MAG: hypothetical protein AVDCRST_MAG73-4163 [uncultured Thermomicrobiales bacterium]|uniref:HTH arsR-type domain-containing protein n=1 Tax=uncultured Thermomicrobiales bacterium TaxID=1645740 RepID=A0A6J4V3T7_9BACT|nr:MAG: hypothetical protein AVDCRST_MAG73-4163 [uncultured Thermomicrobiales bacterium]